MANNVLYGALYLAEYKWENPKIIVDLTNTVCSMAKDKSRNVIHGLGYGSADKDPSQSAVDKDHFNMTKRGLSMSHMLGHVWWTKA